MTPEELEAIKRLVDESNGDVPQATPEMEARCKLDGSRSRLVDALHDYAEIFREKAAMELRRAEAVDVVAAKVATGGSAEQPDLQQSEAFEREQRFMHMRFQELQMRVNRLILEHGDH